MNVLEGRTKETAHVKLERQRENTKEGLRCMEDTLRRSKITSNLSFRRR